MFVSGPRLVRVGKAGQEADGGEVGAKKSAPPAPPRPTAPDPRGDTHCLRVISEHRGFVVLLSAFLSLKCVIPPHNTQHTHGADPSPYTEDHHKLDEAASASPPPLAVAPVRAPPNLRELPTRAA
jgi:hypothetical protein